MSDSAAADESDASPVVEPPRLDDPAGTVRECTAFVRSVVEDADADGVVVNMSGGIDSTVTATLAVDALGADAVYGLVLPAAASDDDNVADARRVADELGIDHRTIDLAPVVDGFTLAFTTGEFEYTPSDPLASTHSRDVLVEPIAHRDGFERALGNVVARLRMAVAYFEANTTNRLVLGTGNRTELELGYFTKYGDGGVDLLPIGDLYKSEVRDLARHLGVPEDIVEKRPTAGLWEAQTDESELGATYATIDAILERLLDENRGIGETADEVGVHRDLVVRFVDKHVGTEHKRAKPPTPLTY